MDIQIKVTPNSSKNEIMGWEGELLRIRVRGVPEKGRVNEELIAFLAKEFGIAKSQITIHSGHTSRLKRLKIAVAQDDEERIRGLLKI
ncbi:MAG: DUF167 domain-containing protein [Parachlamydiales bacterium]|nr:DUF167 domain-containing protein [Parachlamydiales bacterium]